MSGGGSDLRPVELLVRLAEQVRRIDTGAPDGDAAADPARAVIAEGSDPLTDPMRDLDRLRAIGIRKEDDEFVAAGAHRDVFDPEHGTERIGDASEERVAGLVPRESFTFFSPSTSREMMAKEPSRRVPCAVILVSSLRM